MGPVHTRPFHAKSTFSPKENTFGVGFKLRRPPVQAAVPTEPEAAQTLPGPMGSLGLGENQAGAALLSQAASGLRFVPRAQFPFAECSS